MTTIAIHQPSYLPWLGLFEKIHKSDIFVFLDNVTYSKDGYANRNRIKTPEGACWLTIPIVQKGLSRTPIYEVEISNTVNWRKKHWNTIKFNYGRALHFEEYKNFFEGIYRSNWFLLAELNKFLIKTICVFLRIRGVFIDASTLDVGGTSTTLLANICETLDADTYLSGIDGKHYICHELFEQKGIDVVFQEFKCSIYPQLYGGFIPNLSAIDYLLNCGGTLNNFETG